MMCVCIFGFVKAVQVKTPCKENIILVNKFHYTVRMYRQTHTSFILAMRILCAGIVCDT